MLLLAAVGCGGGGGGGTGLPSDLGAHDGGDAAAHDLAATPGCWTAPAVSVDTVSGRLP